MKKLLRQLPKALLLLLVMLVFVQANAQKRLAPLAVADFTFMISNDVQTGTQGQDLEFDLYLLDGSPTIELSTVQVGLLIDKTCLGAGTATITSTATGMTGIMNPPTSMPYYLGTGLAAGLAEFKMSAKSLPGCGAGTTLLTTAPGTLYGHFKIHNSVPFVAGSHASLNFYLGSVSGMLATKVTYYNNCSSTTLALTAANTKPDPNNYHNITLNAPAPTAYAMTGGGSYCAGATTLPTVGLSNSQVGVTYTLYQGGVPQSPTYAGTGAAIPMGNRPGTFTYSVIGVGNGISYSGTTPMSTTVDVTMNPVATITFGALAAVCEGSAPITLTATPAGGTYSGNIYLSGSTFNPTTAGNYNITYNYTNSYGCPSLAVTQPITVNPKPVITFNPLADVCVGGPAIYLTATPAGGTYSGNAYIIPPNQFNPSTVGNYPITYNYSNSFGCAAAPVTQNITVKVCTPTWSGLVNNEWNNAGNWIAGNIPASDGDAIIPAGCPNYPIITHSPMEVIHIGNLTVSGTGSKSVLTGGMAVSGELEVGGNLTITTTGSVDVTADGALTIDGNLLIVGSLLIESQGSMITNGSVSGSATIQRTIPTDMAWHFLSSPVSAQPICNGVFAPTYPGTFPGNIATWDFYNWLPGQCDANLHWRNLRTPTGGVNNVDFPLLAFADSRGYLVAYGSGWSPTKSFVGTPNTADRSLAFYDVTNSCSWALPGNPFPSAVDWSKVTLKENLVTPYYYVWNDATQNYEWWGDGTHFGGVKIDGNIPAEQGFFVKILPSGTLHLNIPNSARVHDNGTDTWIKDAAANKLSLTIDNGTKYNDVSYVMFEDNCNVGVDRKDAEKMFSMNPAVPQIYTIINNDLKACSNSLPYVNNGTTIPVGFVAPVDGNYSITVGNMSSFSSLTGLSIEDLKLNINQDLLQNPVYTFTATGNEDAGRFLLHFAGAIGIDNKDNSPISIYSNEKTVFITCTAGFKNATVTISNLLGQEIVSQNLSDQKTNQVNVNVLKGYYIVKVQSDSSVKTAKVYIN